MFHFKKIFFIILLFSLHAFSQEKLTISGTVYDANNNETLIGVSIYFPSLNSGTTTNEYGFYSITIPKGTYKTQVSYLGYTSIFETINLSEKITKNFKLSEETESLNEIVIEGNIEKLNVKTPQMSVNKLTAATIKQIPVVLGEADVIKALLLLPGVTSAGEGASGFNVRGGAADQNLILLDEAIVFNSSHLLGFFSVFNPDVIKDVKLYKGGIPARFGGRLSSVLDIYQKEGNSKDFNLTGGIGLVSSRLLAEGPIVKEKSSFIVGGRASYAHLFLPLFNNDNKAYFYDLNSKINYRFNENNNVFLSTYFGKDVFGISDNFVNKYGNTVVNLRWNHLFSDKIFSNLSAIYSDYFYGLVLDFVGFEWNSGITNFNLKYDFKHYLNENFKLSYGINNIYIKFNPGEIVPNRADSGIQSEKLIDKYANEFAAYLEAEHSINDRLTLQYGARFSNFTRLGQDEINVYTNDTPVIYNSQFKKYESAQAIGSESYKRSDVLATFNNFEPRVSLSYLIDTETSFKLSYNRMAQYLHLLSNTASPTPLDVWAPSGQFIKPQLLDQFAAGYFKSIKNGDYSLETEVFYKDIQNRIDYINGANLIANNEIETVILNGQARAYGLEVLFKKNEGNFKGWLAYTLAKSEQRTPGRTENEPGINQGEWYNTPYDKTHDISLNASYELSKKWMFNANFLFQTGQPTNYPVGQYEVQGLNVPIFNDNTRNADRLPAYHRLDISATLTPDSNKNRRWQAEWIFGIYNLYGRQNAASINFRQNRETFRNEAIQTSIFGLVPSVTYNFKF
ncbi:TonB-dependent receptor [Polaribacter glomeratus]|uniref:Collagen-binding protein n=1 Tax=Polaribacter glomeratus TaxID=102 RepID=A0A2S7WXG2_9FLAO|nr:TonB-dependent receptor [Polaribacter glomeratus]PQJ82294.1 collagen-binding protein [Polaribacter glomeratus]TXD66888.1 TonB-dependent receptor [Polaribacter glomeratus]